MKKNSLLMIVVSLILSSCGIASQYTSASSEARFQDGIYNSSPSFRSKEEKTESRAMTDTLIKQTKASEIYLFGEKKDTVMIPENMSASIRYDKSLSSTIVTVGENPYAWQNDLDLWSYYTPYSIGSSWYWSRHYDPWFNNYWYWNRWTYSPWSYYGYGGWYGGWYDPWYYGGIYDPWYYGGWYGYGYPYHYGWYHHHHCYPVGPVHVKDHWDGNRRLTGSDRVFASRVSTRGGVGSSTRVSRVSSGQSSGRTTSSVTRSTAAPKRVATAPARAASAKRTATTTRTTPTPTEKVANHRRPAGTTTRTVSSESVNRSTAGRSSTTTYRSSSTSSSSSSSSSYRSSTSPSYRSSSPSTPSRSSSYSPSSAGRSMSGSGGASRSGGSPRR